MPEFGPLDLSVEVVVNRVMKLGATTSHLLINTERPRAWVRWGELAEQCFRGFFVAHRSRSHLRSLVRSLIPKR